MAWNAERFFLDVQQRVDDRPDGLLIESTGCLHCAVIRRGGNAFDLERILADQEATQRLDDRRPPATARNILAEFRPADDAVAGGELQERRRTPSEVTAEDVERANLHGAARDASSDTPAGSEPVKAAPAPIRSRMSSALQPS